MRDVEYRRADDPGSAVGLLAGRSSARIVAGGTDLLNLLREGADDPDLLVDVSRLPLSEVRTGPDGLRLGAVATMADVAAHPDVRAGYPAISQALESAASPQVRNMATIGGNLLQQVRCPYFRSRPGPPCHRRRPGSGCAAVSGEHRSTAVLGADGPCVATHPSDLAVALTALDARVRVLGPDGERTVPAADVRPGAEPGPGELIVGIEVPASALAARSHYLKVRERASFEFALVSVAAATDVRDGVLHDVRLAVGGVAPGPWRPPGLRDALAGAPADAEEIRRRVRPLFDDARPLPGAAFKVELAVRTVVRAVIGGPT